MDKKKTALNLEAMDFVFISDYVNISKERLSGNCSILIHPFLLIISCHGLHYFYKLRPYKARGKKTTYRTAPEPHSLTWFLNIHPNLS